MTVLSYIAPNAVRCKLTYTGERGNVRRMSAYDLAFSERAEGKRASNAYTGDSPDHEATLPNSPNSDNLVRPDKAACLNIPELLIEITLMRKKLLVLTGKHDCALFHYNKAIHTHDGRESVCNSDNRLPFHKSS